MVLTRKEKFALFKLLLDRCIKACDKYKGKIHSALELEKGSEWEPLAQAIEIQLKAHHKPIAANTLRDYGYLYNGKHNFTGKSTKGFDFLCEFVFSKGHQDEDNWEDFLRNRKNLQEARAQYPEVFTEEVHILLLPFELRFEHPAYANGYADTSFNNSFLEMLQDMKATGPLSIHIHEARDIAFPVSADQARELGVKAMADLVLYGVVFYDAPDKPYRVSLKHILADRASRIFTKDLGLGVFFINRLSQIYEGEFQGEIQNVVYWIFGLAAYGLLDYQQALDHFQKLSPQVESVVLYFHQAVCCQYLGKEQQAINYYKKTLEHEPHHIKALINLGIIYMQQEKWEEAKKYLEQTTEIDNKHPYAQYVLGYLYFQQKDYEPAIACFQKTKAAQSGQYPDIDKGTLQELAGFAWYALGRTAILQDQPEKAKDYYWEGLKWVNDPEMFAAYYHFLHRHFHKTLTVELSEIGNEIKKRFHRGNEFKEQLLEDLAYWKSRFLSPTQER